MAGERRTATAGELLEALRAEANPVNVAGMARFGISSEGTLGVSMVKVRELARGLRDHALAEELWASGVHEARILAALVDDPKAVTGEQMERWALDFDSWDVVDQVCIKLFEGLPLAWEKAYAWSERPEEFVKRAGFVMIASKAVHDKKSPDEPFAAFLSVIEREAGDGRNFVKKAVNWALRSIGKRNENLRQAAAASAERIAAQGTPSARWIARDALKELAQHGLKA